VAVSVPIASSDSEYCHRQAEECARRAELAISSEVKTDFKQLEQMWLASAEMDDESLHLLAAGPRTRHLAGFAFVH
jgi:hypothetical protein